MSIFFFREKKPCIVLPIGHDFLMKLGLVCISEILKQRDKTLSFKTMTRKRFNSLNRSIAIRELSERILHNAQLTHKIIAHCAKNNIKHYRVSSNLFPLITDDTLDLSYSVLPHIRDIKAALLQAGDVARQLGISISSHPDQFNVLPSFNVVTVEKSIKELNHQSFVLDAMGCPQDYRAPMCLHLNLSFDSGKESIDDYVNRFTAAFNRCDKGVQKRLVLENEDKGSWNAQNLYRYFGAFMPLVFDNLHDDCNPSSHCYFESFKKTWGNYTPIMHWSEGLADKPRSHSNAFSHIPQIVFSNQDCVWECEVKDKDISILQILRKMVDAAA